MPAFILLELTGINSDIERNYRPEIGMAQPTGRTLDLDEDDLEQPVAEQDLPAQIEAPDADAIGSAPATIPGTVPTGMYYPVAIPLDAVREFYPRRNDKPGTRIVFHNGAPRLVKETFAEVVAKFRAAQAG